MNQNHTKAPVALITGAARRIGAAIASLLHEKGFRVIVHYNQSAIEANELVDGFNKTSSNSAIALYANLMDKSDIEQLIHQSIDWAGQLDCLVNNASVFIKTNPGFLNESDWDTLFTTNVQAPYWLSVTAKPYLDLTKGSIINLGDIHALKPLADYSLYCQSKAALLMQTQSLAKAFAPNIRVNTVSPGAIAWPEKDNALSENIKATIIESTPLKKHGKPEYIAQAVLALIENPFITGVNLPVDGGRSIS